MVSSSLFEKFSSYQTLLYKYILFPHFFLLLSLFLFLFFFRGNDRIFREEEVNIYIYIYPFLHAMADGHPFEAAAAAKGAPAASVPASPRGDVLVSLLTRSIRKRFLFLLNSGLLLCLKLGGFSLTGRV